MFSVTDSAYDVVSLTSQLCARKPYESIFMYHLLQLSVTGLLLTLIKGANRLPCHLHRGVM